VSDENELPWTVSEQTSQITESRGTKAQNIKRRENVKKGVNLKELLEADQGITVHPMWLGDEAKALQGGVAASISEQRGRIRILFYCMVDML
jgi:hypothetical protein